MTRITCMHNVTQDVRTEYCREPATHLITWQTHARNKRPPTFTEPRCAQHVRTFETVLRHGGHTVIQAMPLDLVVTDALNRLDDLVHTAMISGTGAKKAFAQHVARWLASYRAPIHKMGSWGAKAAHTAQERSDGPESPDHSNEHVHVHADQGGLLELCWDCHKPLGESYVTYLPTHWRIVGGSKRNAHRRCMPDGATIVGATHA